MRETKIYCDHCGKVLDCMKDYDDIVIEIGANYIETDLCAECLSELYEIVQKFCDGINLKGNTLKRSFICNGCAYYNPQTGEELSTEICAKCDGSGSKYEPRNQELFDKDPQKYMEHLLIGSL